ncbi:MAG: transposase [Melioribacteraceae bacterium]|nr:transposase [Melioribacteraceae bacterium]
MPYREESKKDSYYHLYNRGNNFEKIFFEKKNYDFFLNRIIKCFNKKIDIVAYVLMPNHYHFIIKLNEDGVLGKAMQKFSTSYTKAVNLSQNRVGHLFQGRYKIKIVPENNYLLHLSRYIHLNPVRKGLVKVPIEYEYSSYNVYVNKVKCSFINNGLIIEQVKNYEEFVLGYQENQNCFVKKLLF